MAKHTQIKAQLLKSVEEIYRTPLMLKYLEEKFRDKWALNELGAANDVGFSEEEKLKLLFK